MIEVFELTGPEILRTVCDEKKYLVCLEFLQGDLASKEQISVRTTSHSHAMAGVPRKTM